MDCTQNGCIIKQYDHSVFLSSVLKTYKCDFLCLQELWLLDETLYRLGSISTEYMYTALSGVDSRKHILQGRPHGDRYYVQEVPY